MVILMKYLLIRIIKLYQAMPISTHQNCRFTPTCSNYAIEAIDEYGSIKGTILAIKRIMRCRPLGNFGYDPVPKKEEK